MARDPLKHCRGPCKAPLPLTEYRRNSKSRDGHESVCKRCRGKQDRVNKLSKLYGITPADYDALLERQGGRCAVCLSFPSGGERLQVDHHHGSGKVRGLLCGACNRALGLLREDPFTIARAAVFVAQQQEV